MQHYLAEQAEIIGVLKEHDAGKHGVYRHLSAAMRAWRAVQVAGRLVYIFTGINPMCIDIGCFSIIPQQIISLMTSGTVIGYNAEDIKAAYSGLEVDLELQLWLAVSIGTKVFLTERAVPGFKAWAACFMQVGHPFQCLTCKPEIGPQFFHEFETASAIVYERIKGLFSGRIENAIRIVNLGIREELQRHESRIAIGPSADFKCSELHRAVAWVGFVNAEIARRCNGKAPANGEEEDRLVEHIQKELFHEGNKNNMPKAFRNPALVPQFIKLCLRPDGVDPTTIAPDFCPALFQDQTYVAVEGTSKLTVAQMNMFIDKIEEADSELEEIYETYPTPVFLEYLEAWAEDFEGSASQTIGTNATVQEDEFAGESIYFLIPEARIHQLQYD